MTRRIRPPMHPVTGHPYVDNELRNEWRKYRKYLRCNPTGKAGPASRQSVLYWYWQPSPAPQPRKARKRLLQSIYTIIFRYSPASHYTPERIILNDPR